MLITIKLNKGATLHICISTIAPSLILYLPKNKPKLNNSMPSSSNIQYIVKAACEHPYN